MKVIEFFRSPMRAYVALTAIYFLLIALLPANKTAQALYGISAAEYKLLLLFVVLPFAAIWFAALYGYSQFKSYARSITDTPEGPHYQRLTRGLSWLAFGLPIAALISLCLNTIANQTSSFLPTAIIINNYISLLIPLVGFMYISVAAKGLIAQSGITTSVRNSRLLIAIFSVLGVLYCYLTFQHFDLTSFTSANNPYYLPLWVMLLTLIMPFLYSWFIGLLAAYELITYSVQTQGILYRRALQYVGYGIVIVIIAFVSLQYAQTVVPRKGYISLNYMLITTYLIRFSLAAGFVCIAIGAKKLKRIEEV